MIKETDYIIYFDSLLAGNKAECVNVVNRLLGQGAEVKEIYTGLLQRSLYRIGQLWEKERIGIACERIASDISLTIIGLLYPRVALTPRNGFKIVITCIDKEHHSIGARIAADIFELAGWETFFLGPCIPCAEVVRSVREFKPDVVGISSNFYLNITRLINLVEELKGEFRGQEIIVGGQIFGNGGAEILNKFVNVKYISSAEMLEKYIKTWNKKHSAK